MRPRMTRMIGGASILLICTGYAAYPQALNTDAHRACFVTPDKRCLLEVAQLERDEFWRASPEDASFNQDTWLDHVVSVEVSAGKLTLAAKHLAEMEPRDLRSLVINEYDEYDEYPDLPPEIDAEGKIRDALETRLSKGSDPEEEPSQGFERRADIALALYGLGYEDRASEVARAATDDFVAAVASGDREVVTAASDLVEAVVGVGLDDAAKRLVRAISRPEMAEKGYSESPGWTNQRALLVYERGVRERHISENAAAVEPPPAEAPVYDRLEAARGWALAGDMDRVIAYIRKLPPGNDFNSRFVQIMLLVEDLLEHDRPDLALVVADEEQSDWDRNNYVISVATYYLSHDQVAEAEALLDRVTDYGARAAMLIWLARDKAAIGEREVARDLLRRGIAALSKEPDPARQTFLNIDVGLVNAELGDVASARAAIDVGLKNIHGIRDGVLHNVPDPMMQFEATVRAATVLTLIGDGLEALAPIEDLLGPDSPSDLAYGAFRTAQAVLGHGKPELAADLVGDSLESMVQTEGIDHQDWSYLFVEAAAALVSTPPK